MQLQVHVVQVSCTQCACMFIGVLPLPRLRQCGSRERGDQKSLPHRPPEVVPLHTSLSPPVPSIVVKSTQRETHLLGRPSVHSSVSSASTRLCSVAIIRHRTSLSCKRKLLPLNPNSPSAPSPPPAAAFYFLSMDLTPLSPSYTWNPLCLFVTGSFHVVACARTPFLFKAEYYPWWIYHILLTHPSICGRRAASMIS